MLWPRRWSVVITFQQLRANAEHFRFAPDPFDAAEPIVRHTQLVPRLLQDEVIAAAGPPHEQDRVRYAAGKLRHRNSFACRDPTAATQVILSSLRVQLEHRRRYGLQSYSAFVAAFIFS